MSHAVTIKFEADDSKSMLGFWIYLMTDCVLFACLFATFIVLRGNDHAALSKELFSLPYVFIETMLLLISSFTSGLAMLAAHNGRLRSALRWFGLTFLFGAGFLIMELTEFSKLVREGHGWQQSGFLSGYFTLVGTHGLHILIGLIWLVVLALQLRRKGLTGNSVKRIGLFNMFWHFLDVVWIFIFSVVYLIGVVA